MKKLIFILGLLFLIQLQTNAQQQSKSPTTNVYNSVKTASFPLTHYSGPGKDQDFYMHRSKNYRIVGWSTLGGGLVLSGIGILVASSQSSNFNSNGSDYAPGILLGLGALSGIVSIPFMIMAHANKNKARLLIDNQKTGFGLPPNESKDIVDITVKIPIGN